VFEVIQLVAKAVALPLQGAELRADVSSSIPFRSRIQWMLFRAQHGRSSKEAKFSTLPELGQAEIVPWKPYKASQSALLGSPFHWEAGEGSSPCSQGEREVCRSFEVVPDASDTCRRCGVAGLIRSQQLINSLTCGALARCPKTKA